MTNYQSKRQTRGVSLRALAIGIILIPLNCYWVAQSEGVSGSGATYLTAVSLFFNVVFTLLMLVGFNALCKRLAPKAALKQGELLTIFVMLYMGSTMTGNGFLLNLILSLGHASRYATPENEWSELFSHYVPDWLAVKDKTALRGFYEGDSSIYRTENINVWLKPLALWSIFAVVLIFTLLCVTVLVRKQWTEREKLSYPIIQLPLAMTRNGTGNTLFSNKLFLLGFGLMAVITMINALHFHFPAVPNLRLRTDISSLFTEKPWNAIGWMHIAVYPWVVGLVFFIPLDLCFSVWFFYLFAKSQRIIASMFGWHRLSWFPLSLSTNDRRMAWAPSHCIMADQEASEERFHTIISRGCKDVRRTRFLKRANESSNSLDRTYSGTLFSDPVLYGRWNVFLDSVTVFCSVDRFADDRHADARGTWAAKPLVLFDGARYYPCDGIGITASGREKSDDADLSVFY